LRWDAKTVSISEEENALALACSVRAGLNPLAPSCAGVHTLDESNWTTLGVAAVVLAHHWLDGLSSLVSVIERDGGDVVVEDVGLDDAVEEMATNEAKFAVDRSGGTTNVVPGFGRIMGEGWVGVLEEGDGNEPVINPKIGNEVPDGHVGPAKFLAKQEEDRGGDRNAEITEQD